MEVHSEGGARRGRGGGNPRGCWTCLSLKLSPEEAFLRSRISGSFWWYQVWSPPGGKAAAIEVCWLVVPRHSYILIKVKIKFRLLYREKLLSTKLSEILTKSLFFCTFWTARLAFEETKARLWGMFARCEMWLVCATWQQKQQLSRGVLTSHIFKWTKLDPFSERKIIKTFFAFQNMEHTNANELHYRQLAAKFIIFWLWLENCWKLSVSTFPTTFSATTFQRFLSRSCSTSCNNGQVVYLNRPH